MILNISSAAELNAYLEIQKKDYDAATAGKSHHAVHVFQALFELTKFCKSQGINCDWIAQAYAADHGEEIKRNYARNQHIGEFTLALINHCPSPSRITTKVFHAVAEWTSMSPEHVKKCYYSLRAAIRQPLKENPNHSIEEHYIKTASCVINDMSNKFSPVHPEIARGYKNLQAAIDSRGLRTVKFPADLVFAKPSKKSEVR